MREMKREGMGSEKGFTMVELIIVIAILGILAAVLVPSFTQMTRKSKFSADLNTIKHVQTQIELYMAEHDGQFPGVADDENPDDGLELDGESGPISVLVAQQYLEPNDTKDEKELNLQSRKEGVVPVYNTQNNAANVALKVTGEKLESIAGGLSERDQRWVVVDIENP